jgi:hypothetical protein
MRWQFCGLEARLPKDRLPYLPLARTLASTKALPPASLHSAYSALARASQNEVPACCHRRRHTKVKEKQIQKLTSVRTLASPASLHWEYSALAVANSPSMRWQFAARRRTFENPGSTVAALWQSARASRMRPSAIRTAARLLKHSAAAFTQL